MADLEPNDLVKELMKGRAAEPAADEDFLNQLAGQENPDARAQLVAEKLAELAAEDLASAFAKSSSVSKLAVFEGYLGPTIEHDGKEWCVLYVDLELWTWLLVEKDGIVKKKTITHTTWPYKRDVIWVGAGAAVGICSGPQSIEAQFLTGEFTRAADFEGPSIGAGPPPATGPFCPPINTAACCRRKSN